MTISGEQQFQLSLNIVEEEDLVILMVEILMETAQV